MLTHTFCARSTTTALRSRLHLSSAQLPYADPASQVRCYALVRSSHLERTYRHAPFKATINPDPSRDSETRPSVQRSSRRIVKLECLSSTMKRRSRGTAGGGQETPGKRRRLTVSDRSSSKDTCTPAISPASPLCVRSFKQVAAPSVNAGH